jgi:hypothetical protein
MIGFAIAEEIWNTVTLKLTFTKCIKLNGMLKMNNDRGSISS